MNWVDCYQKVMYNVGSIVYGGDGRVENPFYIIKRHSEVLSEWKLEWRRVYIKYGQEKKCQKV